MISNMLSNLLIFSIILFSLNNVAHSQEDCKKCVFKCINEGKCPAFVRIEDRCLNKDNSNYEECKIMEKNQMERYFKNNCPCYIECSIPEFFPKLCSK